MNFQLKLTLDRLILNVSIETVDFSEYNVANKRRYNLVIIENQIIFIHIVLSKGLMAIENQLSSPYQSTHPRALCKSPSSEMILTDAK